jgi:hypothetical protein
MYDDFTDTFQYDDGGLAYDWSDKTQYPDNFEGFIKDIHTN